MKKHTLSFRILCIIIFIIILFLTALVSISLGAVSIPVQELLQMFCSGENASIFPPGHWNIVFRIRLPRIIVAGLVGASLALAGVAFQGFLRNPLADPYIVGVSAGAAMGAAISFWLKLDRFIDFISPTPFAAFIGAILTVFLVYQISLVRGRVPVETFLLAGVIIGSFFGALVSLLMLVIQNDLHKLVLWMMGSLSDKNWSHIFLVLPYLLIGGTILWLNARKLNIITMGDERAHYMGVDVEKTKMMLIISASLITAAAVSAGGLIGFVGLVVPHIVRMIFGADHRLLLPLSSLCGAILLIFSDTLARTLAAPVEIPVGIITALLGAPFFCYLLKKRKFYFF